MIASLRPAIVLDTNVVLDWLLFADSSSAPLASAIAHRQVAWVATTAMRDELADVLGRGLARQRQVDPDMVLAAWDARVETRAAPGRMPLASALTCTDPDDQKFLDLAVDAGARWLLTRDRAVLRLAKRAAELKLQITVPEGWSAPT